MKNPPGVTLLFNKVLLQLILTQLSKINLWSVVWSAWSSAYTLLAHVRYLILPGVVRGRSSVVLNERPPFNQQATTMSSV
jgi:hypothetical protein